MEDDHTSLSYLLQLIIIATDMQTQTKLFLH